MEVNKTTENYKDDVVYVDQRWGGPKAGLSFVVSEENDEAFNKQQQEHIKQKDYRYAASALRDEPDRLSLSTRHLIAGLLDAISKKNPNHRPTKYGANETDKQNVILRREFEKMKFEGSKPREINKILREKYHLTQETLRDKLNKADNFWWGGKLINDSEYAEYLTWKANKKPN